ncbi:MAG TPA: carbon-nitrogen hydrolase family protein [Ktedonobacteraceae bacterium]|jgi:predicted amidohydrolase|nr:carbon-nitrogen hydrolase family protein [Ktedonobacteraceae bacterium]
MDAQDGHSFQEARSARLMAVGNRINLHAAVSEDSFSEELERIVGLAVEHLARDRPNLVVLGEVLGLPLALTGKRGYLSRRMHTSNVAMSMLALGYARRIFHYRRMYPDISLVRALLLSLSDRMYRPFTTTLSQLAAKHNIYISASTIVPHVNCSTSLADVVRLGRRTESKVYLPAGPEVYNTGFLWGPDGDLIGTTDKVFLTESEQTILDLTPGDLECVQAFETEMGKVGMAISLDAFTPEYLHKLDSLGARIVIQNDANDAVWAGPCKTWAWQPQEWLNSVLGSVQNDYPNLYYNVCAMQVGNFYDIPFDGQSTITMKSEYEPDPQCNFVGNEGFVHTVTGRSMTGAILAMSPWVVEDPIRAKPGLTLEERRTVLEQVGRQLLPGGPRANQYCESVIWADVEVPVP